MLNSSSNPNGVMGFGVMECVIFHFLNNHVKIHQAQIEKEWL